MNHLGQHFKVLSYGESHGPVVGCIIEGCPAGITLQKDQIQFAVDQRKTGQSDFASSRNETDQVEILSGVFDNITLGSPIAIQIKNQDAHSQDYDKLKDVYRPGHADYTYQTKYGYRDHRGGGRSSIRITAPMVAAGDIARQVVQSLHPLSVVTYVEQIGSIAIPPQSDFSLSEINNTVLRCPHPATAWAMQEHIDAAKQSGDTLGGIIKCIISGLPAGIGEPIFGKLQAQLAHALFSINTVKGVEFGDGFSMAAFPGSAMNDSFVLENERVETLSNHSGGTLGGISNGMPITFRVAFKPISSIQQEQNTLNSSGEAVKLHIGGRHDVCAVPRAVPIVEAYTNIILADLVLHSRLNRI